MAKRGILPGIAALGLLLSLLGTTFTLEPAAATPDACRWSAVNIPAEGEMGNRVLASSSDIQHLTQAADGTLYCHATPSGTSQTLFRSTDNGGSWSATGNVTGTIVDIATAPDDADTIYYATATSIYKSADGGSSFIPLPPNPGGAGSNNIAITSIAVTRKEGSYLVAVGTRDNDAAEYGGAYLLDEAEFFSGWLDTSLGNYDVCAVAFSPSFAADRQLVAVATDETDSTITTKINDTGWAQLVGAAVISGVVATGADIAFPGDYIATTASYTLFVAIDTSSGQGDVYRINGAMAPASSAATDLDAGAAYGPGSIDIGSLAISGNTAEATLLAGAAGTTQVYISTDSGLNWSRSIKEPTGQERTEVLLPPDFASSSTAYAVTSGSSSGFSRTRDGGATWNQVSLIDTAIENIVDLAVSPDYNQDNTLFLLTFGGTHPEHSLWRTSNGGEGWERMLTGSLAGADSLKSVKLSPEYGTTSQVVFLIGDTGASSAIWKSADNGQAFTSRQAPFFIDSWAVVNDDTLLLAGFDGSQGLVCSTTNSGFFYSPLVAAGSQPIKSLAISPDYEQDHTILAGNSYGWVYWSEDNGASFRPLPLSATAPPLTGNIVVVFDPRFASNRVVYAISDTAVTEGSRQRIFRFTIGESDTWQSLTSSLPVGSRLNHLTIAEDGIFYVTNAQAVSSTDGEGGIERSLNPSYSSFETVTRGLDDGTTLTGIWWQGNQLWSMDTTNIKLVTYIDSLNLSPTPISPLHEAQGLDIEDMCLDWETLPEATRYQWQLSENPDFSTLPAGFEGETGKSAAQLPTLETATAYYWRVRAVSPVSSPWSSKWSFTTSLNPSITAFTLYSPQAGTTAIDIQPVFQWNVIEGAESYELLVATDSNFTSTVIARTGELALPANAWRSEVSLEYDTTYYWKVRALGASTHSVWSPVSAFTTEPPPAEPPAEEMAPPSPPPLSSSSLPPPSSTSSQTIPDWAIYTAGALLLTTMILSIVTLVLVVSMRQGQH